MRPGELGRHIAKLPTSAPIAAKLELQMAASRLTSELR
jgi:hypothetical protein